MKRAFLFSGQGAQYQGMGQEIYNSYAVARTIFEEASDVLGYDMAKLCFEKNELLNETQYTQPAILTVNHALYTVATQAGLTADMVAGLSLGEYNALLASEVFSFSEGVKLVAKRGQYMAEAVPKGSGKMVAVLNAKVTLIETICKEVSMKLNKIVVPANYNTPQQIVIGGEAEAVDCAVSQLAENGVKRMMPLNVSGPFHTPLLVTASKKLASELDTVNFLNGKLPVVSNTTAQVMLDEERKSLLERQVMEPVRFYESIETFKTMGVNEFVEIGPGKVLSGFLKKIDKELTCHRIENQQTFTETLAYFN